VEHVGQDPRGNDLIRYRKRDNGVTYYVEEVRNKRGELMAKTMWKTRTRERMPTSDEASSLLRP
jgi:hypothetical protein